jgi:putative redox protein
VVKGKGLDEKKVARAVDMTAEKYCSVSIMLAKSVDVTHDFEIVEEDQD